VSILSAGHFRIFYLTDSQIRSYKLAPSEASYSPPPKTTHENNAEISIVSPTTVSPIYGTVPPGKKNGVAAIMVGRVKASAPACMINWRKQTIASLLEDAVNQNVIFSRKPKGNKNPLGLPHHTTSDKVSKNSWQESRGAVKFLASFCENMDEYAFYTGDKRITKNDSLSERTIFARTLGEMLEGRVHEYIKESSIKVKNDIEIGWIYRNLVEKGDKKCFRIKIAKTDSWDTIKKQMVKKIKEGGGKNANQNNTK
jgi:hypothetical protein